MDEARGGDRQDRGPLGILAGGGELPRRLIAACHDRGREVFVVAFDGQTDRETTAMAPHVWARLGAAGTVLAALREREVAEIVFAGPIRRPGLSEVRPDWRAARFFASIGKRAFSDDGLLGSIVRALEEEEGFRVAGGEEILGLKSLAEAGTLGKMEPDARARVDIERGVEVALALGGLDVGQAVVVQQGVVLGVEAVEGTDALLRRAGEQRRIGGGGVLVKLKKPQQEARIDLPTVGVTTVRLASEAGLRGIAVQAGATLVIDRDATVAAADAAGLFIVGLTLDP